MNDRLSITDVAKRLGITPRTIMRWEKTGKIKRSKRDWRGWRFYLEEDLKDIKKFYESSYEYEEGGRTIMDLTKTTIIWISLLTASLAPSIVCGEVSAQSDAAVSRAGSSGVVKETNTSVDINLSRLPAVKQPPLTLAEASKYTLGPDDVIEIEVRRHPEFSGMYTVTAEGKIEYKFVGDVIVGGLTKVQLQERLKEILSEYLIGPEVNVRIAAYLSKVFYVVGEVGLPGKFYMKGNTITAREALMMAGLPTVSAAMRRSRLITPDNNRDNNYVTINVYSLLYEGNLKENKEIKPGEVLYVPATIIAKAIRIISPVTNAVSEAGGAAAKGAGIAVAAL